MNLQVQHGLNGATTQLVQKPVGRASKPGPAHAKSRMLAKSAKAKPNRPKLAI